MELGFALSSEDHPPNELVKQAQIAERAGFTVALPAPRDFEEAAGNVTVADVASLTPTGPDPGPYLELIQKCEKAGFTTSTSTRSATTRRISPSSRAGS